MFNKALITGGTGFIGTHLIDSLVDKGWDLSVIIRSNSNITNLSKYTSQIQFLEHDGSMDSMQDIVDQSSPDVVFHLATHFVSDHNSTDLGALFFSNILFGSQLLEALSSHDSKNIINTGTSWQHFGNLDYSPVNLYSSTKKAFEDILHYYHEARSFNVINLKLFDTYGPNDPRGKLFSVLQNAQSENKVLEMSKGEQLLDLLHVDDVVRALLRCILFFERDEISFRDFAISSGNPISLKKVVETFSIASEKKIKVNWGGRDYKEREVMVPWSKGNNLPNWKPKIDLMSGLKKIFNDKNS